MVSAVQSTICDNMTAVHKAVFRRMGIDQTFSHGLSYRIAIYTVQLESLYIIQQYLSMICKFIRGGCKVMVHKMKF